MEDPDRKVYERLLELRKRTDLAIRPTKHLRQRFTSFDGSERELKLRYYQVQMVFHLLSMRKFVVGDDTGTGKTLETIATMCYLWEKEPNLKAMVLTKKSAVTQWASEIQRFTDGVGCFVAKGTKKERERAYAAYRAHEGPAILVTGYRTVVQDFTQMQGWSWDLSVFDEATVFKSPTTQIHQICKFIAGQSARSWGLTATLIKNNLVEGYGVYKVLIPQLFTHSPTAFVQEYCAVEMIDIGHGRKVPRIIGYRVRDIERFKDKIAPYYLGRPKHEVAAELPPLTTLIHNVTMGTFQAQKYKEALDGMLVVMQEGEYTEKEVNKLVAVTYCQEIVNHPGLIGFPDQGSAKLDELVELITEGDFAGEKVIIFTRFAKMVDIGVAALAKAKIKSVRITGAEGEDARKASQDTFQDAKSGIDVVWITTAGSDAINLQAAKVVIFYDTPFSAGDYLQILGRMIRIGSIHDRVFAVHMVCDGTIDERIMQRVDSKMKLIEYVLGKRLKGESDDSEMLASDGDVSALFDALQDDAKKGFLRVV